MVRHLGTGRLPRDRSYGGPPKMKRLLPALAIASLLGGCAPGIIAGSEGSGSGGTGIPVSVGSGGAGSITGGGFGGAAIGTDPGAGGASGTTSTAGSGIPCPV